MSSNHGIRGSSSATTCRGALGISGLTAYFGLLDVGRPEPGQTVLVSGAAGSVGSIVGQIARIKGCRAGGIAGGEDKRRWLVEEVGFDAAIDYKSADLRKELKLHAPDGVDVYFDNVGGPTLEAALNRLARGTRKGLRNWRTGSTAASCNHTSRSSTVASAPSPARCSSCSAAKTPAS